MSFEPKRLPFNDRVAMMLDRVTYRSADSAADRDAIFRLRYRAYLREDAIVPNAAESFSDPYDDAENAWVLGMYVDDELAGSVRMHITTPTCRKLPAMDVFGDVLAPHVDAGKIVIDPTRFVIDEKFARQGPEYPFITLRLMGLASDYFNADMVLSTVRAEHAPFYRRACGQELMSEPRLYPSLTKPIVCMAAEHPVARERTYERFPFLRSQSGERNALFGDQRGRALAAAIAGNKSQQMNIEPKRFADSNAMATLSLAGFPLL